MITLSQHIAPKIREWLEAGRIEYREAQPIFTFMFATKTTLQPKDNPMQAIETRYIPATNFRPTRIKAECARGSLTVCRDSLPDGSTNGEGAHISAARLLCEQFAQEDAKRYGSDQSKNPWLRPLTTGTLKNGNCVHVFAS